MVVHTTGTLGDLILTGAVASVGEVALAGAVVSVGVAVTGEVAAGAAAQLLEMTITELDQTAVLKMVSALDLTDL